MDFESPDVEKDFPGLFVSVSSKKTLSESDYSDNEKSGRKEILVKKKDKKESKKDKGYMAFEGESSDNEAGKTRSPGRGRKNKSFKFPGKDRKEKLKVKERETKEKERYEEECKPCKKECKFSKKDIKKLKGKNNEEKYKREMKLLKAREKKKRVDQCVEQKQIFGVPLHEAVERDRGRDNISVPVIVRECIEYIEEHGLTCEGIYRISGVKSKVQQLKAQCNKGEKIYFYKHEPPVIASLLKQFLSDLPEPLLTTELLSKFEETATIKNEEMQITLLKNLMSALPTCNFLLLSWMVLHMVHVAKMETKNKMNFQNLSLVFGPAMKISHNLLHVLFSRCDVIFKGIEIKKYVSAVCPDSDYLLETGSPSAIEQELLHHETLLSVIHAELNAGLRDAKKEEQLWEIQRIVTQLKRKLRSLYHMQDAPRAADSFNSENTSSELMTDVACAVQVRDNPKRESNELVIPDEISSAGTTLHVAEVGVDDAEKSEFADPGVISPEESVLEEIVLASDKRMQISDEEENCEHCDSSISSKEVQDAAENEIANEEGINACPTAKVLDDLKDDGIMLVIEEEELLFLADELKRKIEAERVEIKRLKDSIAQLKCTQLSPGPKENSTDTNASSSSEEEADVLHNITKKNEKLKDKNRNLGKEILHEREVCIDLKVQIKVKMKKSTNRSEI